MWFYCSHGKNSSTSHHEYTGTNEKIEILSKEIGKQQQHYRPYKEEPNGIWELENTITKIKHLSGWGQ